MRFFDDFSRIFQFQTLDFSWSKSKYMFSRDRLITGVIGRKLDENRPNLFANLLYTDGL